MGDKLRASGMFGDAFVRNGYTISREGSDEYVAFVSGDAPQSHALTEKMVLAYNVHDALVEACRLAAGWLPRRPDEAEEVYEKVRVALALAGEKP